MRVLAIDPGYDRVGVAVLDNQNAKEELLFSDCLQSQKSDHLNERLYNICTTIEKLIPEYQVDTLAIETLFFNKNIKTAIAVAEVRGAIIYIAKKHNLPIYEFGPQEIKVAVTGYGKSDKTAVLAMLKRLIPNLKTTALDDEYDAIATGITCLAHYGRSS